MLAIDYGQSRVGTAISDSNGRVASPLEVIRVTRKTGMDGVLNRINEICEQNRVKTILIGQPQAFADSHNKIKREIDRFKLKLADETGLEIIDHDESFSTSNAKNMLLSLSSSRSKRREQIDKFAASYFLQEYLDAAARKKSI